MKRSSRMLWAHIPFFGYLLTLGLPGLAFTNDPMWLFTHILLLGAITNLIFFWSSHFTQTLLRRPSKEDGLNFWLRLSVLNVGILFTLVGKSTELSPLLLAGTTIVIASALTHGLLIIAEIRIALPARFKKIPRFYVAALFCLSIGAGIGFKMSQIEDSDFKSRLLLIHYSLNILGWVGVTIAGTVVTFLPTMQRVRLPENAEKYAYKAFYLLLSGILVVVLALSFSSKVIVAVGLLIYCLGWILLITPHVSSLRSKKTKSFSVNSAIAVFFWLFVSLLASIYQLIQSSSWSTFMGNIEHFSFYLGIGFALQMGFAALHYLVPTMFGGGPTNVRELILIGSKFTNTRLFTLNLGTLLIGFSHHKVLFISGCTFLVVALLLNIGILSHLIRKGVLSNSSNSVLKKVRR